MSEAQGDLFGATRGPQAAVAGAAFAGLAGQLPAGVRLGTSTWSFPGWRGIVYQHEHRETELARRGLAAYAGHPLLRAVGVDRGFYAPVPREDLSRWAADVDPGFRFLIKAHAALTTPRGARRPAFLADAPPAFLDAGHAVRAVIEPAAEALGPRLGIVLFQFSPLGERVLRHRELLLERLGAFLRSLPRVATYAVEWRDPAMLGDDYHAVLDASGAVHGFCAHPRMPSLAVQCPSGGPRGPLVLRWLLGGGRRYDEARAAFAPFDRLVEPDPTVRGEVARLVAGAAAAGQQATVIVNNKAEGSAPLSVCELAREIAGRCAAAC
jgi:uncharacterized protein YecE (DUF72 family)